MPENNGNATARILVADDERSIRWVLSEALTADGHQVTEASTGSEALAILNRGGIDVAFLDIRMPDMNGLDVVTKAREAGCQTTLVVMTAQTTMANAVEAMKRGAYDYLTKPFSLGQIDVVLRRIDDYAALQAENERLARQVAQKDGLDLRQAFLTRLEAIENRLTRIEAALRSR